MTIGEELVVLSANCQGLQNKNKRMDVIDYFQKTKAAIICLQDTHWTPSDESNVRTIWKGDCILNGCSSNSRGVAILFNTNFEYKILSVHKDTEGNMLSVDINIGEISITLINIYGPNRDSPDFFGKIKAIIETSNQMYTIICGDLNLVLNPQLDCDQYKHVNNPKSRDTVIELMNTFDLKDTFRLMHPFLRRYTWRRKTPLRQARLDYFLVSHPMHDIITNCSINPGYRSDHSSLQIKILLSKFDRGRGLWKLNCSLLKDDKYISLVNKLIQEEKLKYAIPVYNLNYLNIMSSEDIVFTINDGNFLEMLLLRIRGETVKYSSYCKKQEHEHENRLKNEIQHLENSFNPVSFKILEDKKTELEALRQKAIIGSVIRSRAEWINEGEKPTKYFCSLEKYNYIEKTIKCIQLDNGETLTDQKSILDEIAKFYSTLFAQNDHSPSDQNLHKLFEGKNIYKLTPTESMKLEGKLKLEEISNALKQMKNNKCPGVDGFPAEFFKTFWDKLKYFVLRALNFAFDTGELSVSLRTCVISCLPKGDKPRKFLKNWRPISLLSVLYKIASTAIANRLKTVLIKLISDTQSGFISGRFIGENTRLVYDIMHYLEKNKLPGLLMLVDFQKAFDSVSWIFLNNVLKFYNFGRDFCHWINVLNKNIQASILQSGHLSYFFAIHRGCRQGDPIASYLFLLSAQILYLMVFYNCKINGITINNNQYKISQFADDTTLFLDGTSDSLKAALNTLEIFGSLSGLVVNKDKTKLIWLGKKKRSTDMYDTCENLVWGATEFDLLGLHFSVDLENITTLNYLPILNKCQKIINQWKRRKLSPLGKITIIKTFILSSFNHIFTSLPAPSTFLIKKLNNLVYSFIWDNKPDKINRKQITNSYFHGGLKMVDIDVFIKCQKLTWMRRLIQSPDVPWAKLFSSLICAEKFYLLGPLWTQITASNISNDLLEGSFHGMGLLA